MVGGVTQNWPLWESDVKQTRISRMMKYRELFDFSDGKLFTGGVIPQI